MTDPKEFDFEYIFGNCDNTLCAMNDYSDRNGQFSDINLSSILTVLIQNAGRYCESYASDLFTDWEQVRKFINDSPAADKRKLFVFGFRKNGVDHETFIKNSKTCCTRYRKILAVDIRCTYDIDFHEQKQLHIALKDITNDCIGITD